MFLLPAFHVAHEAMILFSLTENTSCEKLLCTYDYTSMLLRLTHIDSQFSRRRNYEINASPTSLDY